MCDQGVSVDIIPPPYDEISQTITVPGAQEYFHVALSKGTTQIHENSGSLYVADPEAEVVWVVDYPNGTLATSLNGANGLATPSGMAAHPELQN